MSPAALVEPGRITSFSVRGKAEPAGSKKGFVRGGRAHIVDANKNAAGWKKTVGKVGLVWMNGRQPIEGPVSLELSFLMKRPPSHLLRDGSLSAEGRRRLHHVQAPDVLKLARAVEDALTGVVYVDDGQIVHETLKKRWAVGGEMPGVTITVIER